MAKTDSAVAMRGRHGSTAQPRRMLTNANVLQNFRRANAWLAGRGTGAM
jgi:hypothetical protein